MLSLGSTYPAVTHHSGTLQTPSPPGATTGSSNRNPIRARALAHAASATSTTINTINDCTNDPVPPLRQHLKTFLMDVLHW